MVKHQAGAKCNSWVRIDAGVLFAMRCSLGLGRRRRAVVTSTQRMHPNQNSQQLWDLTTLIGIAAIRLMLNRIAQA